MEAAVLIGIQGSGKSTFAQRQLGATHVRISRDVVKTAHRERVLHYACLSVGQAFVADNNHCEPPSRAPLIAAARAAGFRVVAYYFPPKVEASLRRNLERSGRLRVPDVAIHANAKRLVVPALAEGYDAIFHVHLEGQGQFTVQESSHE